MADTTALKNSINTIRPANPKIAAVFDQVEKICQLSISQDISDKYAVSGAATDRALTAKAYSISHTPDRTFNANSYTTDEMADVLSTLITDFSELQNVMMTLIADLRDRKIVG